MTQITGLEVTSLPGVEWVIANCRSFSLPWGLMLGFTAESDVLISAAADGTVRAWSLPGQKQLSEVRAEASRGRPGRQRCR
ncbi:MAG: hypothetical protein JWN00_2161 [Actinomycetia bacterium]|nr:hypothetical protein [Actinomycetes bacterium]